MGKAQDDYVLDLARNRRGYALNRMCGSLKEAALAVFEDLDGEAKA